MQRSGVGPGLLKPPWLVSSSAGRDLKLCVRGPGLQGLSLHQLSRCLTLGSLMAFTCDPGWTSGLSLQLPSAPRGWQGGAGGPEEGTGVVFLYSMGSYSRVELGTLMVAKRLGCHLATAGIQEMPPGHTCQQVHTAEW